MKVTWKRIAALSAAFVGCIILTLILCFAGTGSDAEEEQEATYFFANYGSAESLMAASVENESGSAVFAMVNGQFLVSTEEDIGANAAGIYSFFNSAYRLPLERLLEDASAEDAQYGLTDPKARITVQDVDGDGFIFLIGAQTPAGEGYYTCLSGDDRVFIMSTVYAEKFLGDVNQYYDLSLFPALGDGGIGDLASVEVSERGETVYRLEKVSYLKESDLAYFALTDPGRLLMGASQFDNEIQASLEALYGTDLITEVEDPEEYGITESSRRMTLTYDDGSEYSVLIGKEENGSVYVMKEGSGAVYAVPASETGFISGSAADLFDSGLISLNLASMTEIRINDAAYEISGSSADLTITKNGQAVDTSEFQNTVYEAVKNLDVQGELSDEKVTGSPILTIEIDTSIEGEHLSLSFYELDSRRCAVFLGEDAVFWCNKGIVNELISAAE